MPIAHDGCKDIAPADSWLSAFPAAHFAAEQQAHGLTIDWSPELEPPLPDQLGALDAVSSGCQTDASIEAFMRRSGLTPPESLSRALGLVLDFYDVNSIEEAVIAAHTRGDLVTPVEDDQRKHPRGTRDIIDLVAKGLAVERSPLYEKAAEFIGSRFGPEMVRRCYMLGLLHTPSSGTPKAQRLIVAPKTLLTEEQKYGVRSRLPVLQARAEGLNNLQVAARLRLTSEHMAGKHARRGARALDCPTTGAGIARACLEGLVRTEPIDTPANPHVTLAMLKVAVLAACGLGEDESGRALAVGKGTIHAHRLRLMHAIGLEEPDSKDRGPSPGRMDGAFPRLLKLGYLIAARPQA